MNFPSHVLVAAFGAGLVATGLALPLWRRWCRRTGLVDDPGHRKIHSEPIPLAGGLAVLTGMLLPLLGAALVLAVLPGDENFLGKLAYGMSKRAEQVLAIAMGALGITGLGWLDDKHELRPMAKFAGQVAIATLVAAAGVRVTLFIPSVVFSYAITILWCLTVINAFNFMDNMNGLCAGLGALGALFFGLLAAMDGQYLVASMALLMCGALVGFLPYNFPRARAFLGDSGSHLVGYLLAVMAILPHFHTPENPRPLAVVTPLLVLAVPLADLGWVVLLRWRAGQPFYVGDTNHLSHRLVRRGLSQTRAVLVIWLIAALLGALALL